MKILSMLMIALSVALWAAFAATIAVAANAGLSPDTAAAATVLGFTGCQVAAIAAAIWKA